MTPGEWGDFLIRDLRIYSELGCIGVKGTYPPFLGVTLGHPLNRT